MNNKQIEYGLAGIGSGLLLYYILSKLRSKTPTQASASSTGTQNAITPTTSQPSVNAQCQNITPNNFSNQLLASCFGGEITSCGLYKPLTTVNGFCEAFSPSTNYSMTKPDISSGLMFYNSTNAFFGIYWAYPGVFGGTSPCYCNGTTQVFPSDKTGAFYNFIGLIMPNGYTWLPTYYFPSSGLGFLTYNGALWYSPGLTYASLSYIKNNNLVYTINLENTPDKLGYSIQTYTTPSSTGGDLCFDYVDLNSNFCISVAPNQIIPFWVNSNTTVKWCPANNPLNCQVVS